ncbi:hypothetical protein MLD38_001225 [Melastoma candidum]|uniref:Uncharacterized protein n=1 Tax=Melastoma candidum TaxID=119954 RepID=A0ACB9SGH2_9MYRT|nr:hypothetical protein MLD38_001225 [Melastoma candidum]
MDRTGGPVRTAMNPYRQRDNTQKSSLRTKELFPAQDGGRNGKVPRRGARNGEKHLPYEEVVRELEFVKRELSRLKISMATVMEENVRAEVETEASKSKAGSYSGWADALRKEIEEICEEQVLVELAQIEAMKECTEIGAQRAKEADRYSSMLARSRKKIEDAKEEIEQSKEIEGKLALTLSDVTMLKNELKLAKGMDKRVAADGEPVRNEEVEPVDATKLLESVTKELEAANRELALVREEGYQFMSSMDVIRNELKHVTEERVRVKKSEEESNETVQDLNSKLERAKSKMEAAKLAEEKAKGLASNLMLTLEQLKAQAEAARKENKVIIEEIANLKAEIEKTDGEIESAEGKLEAAMGELEEVRVSETAALENLKTLIENIVHERASAYQNRTTVTVSKYEYDYLKRRAAGAEEVADKKVAAAQAWVEALKASEREILMRTEVAQREAREMRVEEEQQVYRLERSLSVKRRVETEIKSWRPTLEKNPEDEVVQLGIPRNSKKKLVKDNSSSSHAGRFRRSAASPGNRYLPRSTSVSLKKRKKVMPNLSKLLKRDARTKEDEI